jgi:hypothetical protein
VLLPGFQKGRDIEACEGKGQGAALAKKGQFASYNAKTFKTLGGSLPDGAGIINYQ